jgi:hypothetical protein
MLSAIIINEVIRVDLVVFLAIFAGELLAPPPLACYLLMILP